MKRISEVWKHRMFPGVHKDNKMYCSPPNTAGGDLTIDCGASTRRSSNGVREIVAADDAVIDYRGTCGSWMISPQRSFYTRNPLGTVGSSSGTTPASDAQQADALTISQTSRRIDATNLTTSTPCYLASLDVLSDKDLNDWWTFEYRARIRRNDGDLRLGVRLTASYMTNAGDFLQDVALGTTPETHPDLTHGTDAYFHAAKVETDGSFDIWHIWLSWKQDKNATSVNNGSRIAISGAGIVDVFESQLHRGFGASQYFGHSGANAVETRTAGALSDFNQALDAYTGSAEGSWLMDFDLRNPGTSEGGLVSLYETSITDLSIALFTGTYAAHGANISAGSAQIRYYHAAATFDSVTLSAWSWFGRNKILVRWNADGFTVFCNGVLEGTISQTPSTDFSNMGWASTGESCPDMGWRESWLSDELLTDAECITETTV